MNKLECCGKPMMLNDTSRGKFYGCVVCSRFIDEDGNDTDANGVRIEDKLKPEIDLRDSFARAALTGMLHNYTVVGDRTTLPHIALNTAEASYIYADAMLEARKGKPKKEKQFIRPDVLLHSRSTPKEVQRVLYDPRYQVVAVENGSQHGVTIPPGKCLAVMPSLKENA